MSNDKHWYGGITSPWPMTAEKFADRLRKKWGHVRVMSPTKIVAANYAGDKHATFVGKDY